MKVKLKTAFSLLDGRLSSEIKDVYEMLNFIFSDNLFTHQLPWAMRRIKGLNPDWFRNGCDIIEGIKSKLQSDDFDLIMREIDLNFSQTEIELQKIDEKIPL